MCGNDSLSSLKPERIILMKLAYVNTLIEVPESLISYFSPCLSVYA